MIPDCPFFPAGCGIRTHVSCRGRFSSSREYVESSGTTWNLVELYGILTNRLNLLVSPFFMRFHGFFSLFWFILFPEYGVFAAICVQRYFRGFLGKLLEFLLEIARKYRYGRKSGSASVFVAPALLYSNPLRQSLHKHGII